MSCYHDECNQGRKSCTRLECQAAESCDFPLTKRDLALVIAAGFILWLALAVTFGV